MDMCHFQDASGFMYAYEVPPPGNVLYLPVVRLAGAAGRLVLYWETQPVSATYEDFSPTSGNITFQDGTVIIIIIIIQ